MTRNLIVYPWEELAEEYHQRGFQQTDLLGYGAVEKLLGDIRGKTVLDFGCGDGKFSRFMAEEMSANVIGVDSSAQMIRLALEQKISGASFRYIDEHFDQLPCSETSIDKAVANFVFCTMLYLEVGRIQEIYKALRPGGTFTVLEPNPASIGREYQSMKSECVGQFKSGQMVKLFLSGIEEPFFDHWYTKEDMTSVLTNTGFSIDQILEPTVNSRRFAEDMDDGIDWKDEVKYPPFYVIQARKVK